MACQYRFWPLHAGHWWNKVYNTFLVVDKKTSFKLVYRLKNLTGSLFTSIKQFIQDSMVKQKLIQTDFDHKIIGGQVKEYLLKEDIQIKASPPYRQRQNSLVEWR